MEIHIYEGKTRLDIWRVKDYYPIPNVGEYIHITGFVTDKKVLQRVFGENVITFYEVEYKGHSYIMFMYAVGYVGYAGLTHNPDCPCKKGGDDE